MPGEDAVRPFAIQKALLQDITFRYDILKSHSHVGIHVEVGVHYYDGGKTITDYLLDQFHGPGVFFSVKDLSRWPNAHYATKEEALEREQLAYENGLVPHLGKLRSDAALYGVLEYEDEFMDICHCCSCCCVVSLTKYDSQE